MHLPGPKNIAKQAKISIDCWNLFIDDLMIRSIVECTKAANYSEKSIVQETTNIEIKAVFGLLYMAGSIELAGLIWKTYGLLMVLA